MKYSLLAGAGAAWAAALFLAPSTPAQGGRPAAMFEVTVTNLTRGQPISPLLVVTHDAKTALFVPGQAASPELALMAEDGDNSQLAALASSLPGVHAVASGAAPIGPGGSETVVVAATGNRRHLSLAGMLVNTNDAFMALDSLELTSQDTVVNAVAYDAGSEFNSESCAFIPGPACNNPFQHDPTAAEGFVYVSNGIQGVGDLAPELYDWRNPVARIQIRRLP